MNEQSSEVTKGPDLAPAPKLFMKKYDFFSFLFFNFLGASCSAAIVQLNLLGLRLEQNSTLSQALAGSTLWRSFVFFFLSSILSPKKKKTKFFLRNLVKFFRFQIFLLALFTSASFLMMCAVLSYDVYLYPVTCMMKVILRNVFRLRLTTFPILIFF